MLPAGDIRVSKEETATRTETPYTLVSTRSYWEGREASAILT